MTRRLAALLAVAALALSFRLGGYPLLEPDEGRNAEVAREMAARNDFLVPRLNGLPYVDKPVVFFAAAAMAVELLGATEWAVRIPPLLFTFGTVGLVGWWGRRLFGPPGGLIAAVATAASPLTLGFARTVIMDSAVTFFVTGALVAFSQAADYPREPSTGGAGATTPTPPRFRSAETWSALGWLALALGALTKGPVALALPLVVAIPYFTWRRTWRPLGDPLGILLFLAIVLPWTRTMAQAAPGYLEHVFVTETFQRVTTPALQRTGPWWYFFPILLAGALPWSLVLIGSGGAMVRRMRRPIDGRVLLLLLWIIVPLVLFSLSQSKRPQYVLPLIPAVALLVAALWARPENPAPGTPAESLPGVRAAGGGLVALGAFLLVAPGILPEVIRGVSPAVAAEIPFTARVLGTAALAGGFAAWMGRRRIDVAAAALALPVLVIPFASMNLMREIGDDRSSRALAAAIDRVVTAETQVVAVAAYPLSLPFYLGRTIVLATSTGEELTSNYIPRTIEIWRDAPDSPLRPPEWWREAALLCEHPRVFVIRAGDDAAREVLEPRMPLLAHTRKYAAFGPCGTRTLAGRGERRVAAASGMVQ